jgi:hypothetical protein
MGMPATGKSFTIPGVSIWEVIDGQLISEWVSWDTMGMMQQLGLAPAPPCSRTLSVDSVRQNPQWARGDLNPHDLAITGT